MTRINPEQERERLAARYAAMNDLELLKVGGDPAALTEWARETLRDEMRRRGLEWKPDPRSPKPVAEEEILKGLGIYPDRIAAGLVRDFLDDNGIKAHFYEPGRFDDGESSRTEGAMGTQLVVRAKDLVAARQQLAQQNELAMSSAEDLRELAQTGRPVVLRRYRDLPAAVVDKSILDSAGILSFLQDDNVVRMDWLWSNAMGGIKLIVCGNDALEAEAILNQAPPSEQSAARMEEP